MTPKMNLNMQLSIEMDLTLKTTDEVNPMIEAIDKRLLNWAEWRLGSIQGTGGCNGVMSAIIEGKGVVVRSTATEIYIPDAVLDTDQAVMQLEPMYQQVIELQYMEILSPDQRASKAGVSRKTFYRRLNTAQQHVLFYLKPGAAAKPSAVREGFQGMRKVELTLGRVD